MGDLSFYMQCFPPDSDQKCKTDVAPATRTSVSASAEWTRLSKWDQISPWNLFYSRFQNASKTSQTSWRLRCQTLASYTEWLITPPLPSYGSTVGVTGRRRNNNDPDKQLKSGQGQRGSINATGDALLHGFVGGSLCAQATADEPSQLL